MPSQVAEIPKGSPEVEQLLPAEVPMTEEERQALVLHIDTELHNADGERSKYVEELKNAYVVYDTPKPTGIKLWPFKKASQITVPVAKMVVNVLAPRIVDELLRTDPPWQLKTSHEEEIFERAGKHVEDFMGLYAKRRIMFENKLENMILEGCKVGTGAWQVVMDQDIRQGARYTEDMLAIELAIDKVSFGPQIHNVPQEDFWWKYGYTNVQEMPWVGKTFHLTDRQIVDRVQNKRFRRDEAEKFVNKSFLSGSTSLKVTEQREQHEKTVPLSPTERPHEIFELYIYWPIRVPDPRTNRSRQVTADLIVYYHRETRALLRVQLNPWWHRRRPFLVWTYTPVEYRLVGEGIIRQVEQFQEEITAMHRLRLDNATLSTMRMVIIGKSVEGLRPGDPLYPGKVLRASTPKDDVVPFQLTDIYPTTVLNENISMSLVERLTGVNEAALGQALPITRTTATAQVTLAEEAKQRFNLTIRRARRDTIGAAGEYIYDLFHQFGTDGLAEEWLGPIRGRIVETLFSFPREKVLQGISLHVRPTSPRLNRPMEMQANLQMFQILVQLHQQLIPLVMQFAPQAMPFITRGLVTGSKKYMTRVLESFDEPDPEGVLQALTLVERLLPTAPDLEGKAALLGQLQELQAQVDQLGPNIAGEVGSRLAPQIAGLAGALSPAGGANGRNLLMGGGF